MPDGRAVLVDAGAGGPYRLDAGERVVAPFLWNRGVLRLAAIVVTHPDIDHAGGMAAVRELFGVDEAWDGSLERGPLALGGAVLTPLPTAAAPRAPTSPAPPATAPSSWSPTAATSTSPAGSRARQQGIASTPTRPASRPLKSGPDARRRRKHRLRCTTKPMATFQRPATC